MLLISSLTRRIIWHMEDGLDRDSATAAER